MLTPQHKLTEWANVLMGKDVTPAIPRHYGRSNELKQDGRSNELKQIGSFTVLEHVTPAIPRQYGRSNELKAGNK